MMRSRLATALAFLSGLLVPLAYAGAQALPACNVTPLVQEDSNTNLRILLHAGREWGTPAPSVPAADWAARRGRAFSALEEYLAKCDAFKELQFDGSVLGAIWEKSAYPQDWLKTALADAIQYAGNSSPVLSDILKAGAGGIHVPQRFELALSQVVSAGQPGFSLGGTGALDPLSSNAFLRRSTASLGALVIQPVGGGGSTPADPQFASLDVAYAYSGETTVRDWIVKLVQSKAQIKLARFADASGLFATQQFLRSYAAALVTFQAAESANDKRDSDDLAKESDATKKEALAKEQASAKAKRIEEFRRLAAQNATVSGNLLYRERIRDYFAEGPVAVELKRARHPSHADVAFRFRVSPRPEFVPELPDMLSLGLDVVYEGEVLHATGDRSSWLRYHAKLLGSASAYPRSRCSRFSDCEFDPTALLDAAVGVSMDLPTAAAQAPTRITVAGVGRWAPNRNVVVDGKTHKDASAGFTVGVAVPLTATVSLVGTYIQRWTDGGEVFATSGITIAKDVKP